MNILYAAGGAYFGGSELGFVADHFNAVIAVYEEGQL